MGEDAISLLMGLLPVFTNDFGLRCARFENGGRSASLWSVDHYPYSVKFGVDDPNHS